MGQTPKQAGVLLVPVKKTSAEEISSLVGLFNDYRKIGEEIIRVTQN